MVLISINALIVNSFFIYFLSIQDTPKIVLNANYRQNNKYDYIKKSVKSLYASVFFDRITL